MALYADYAIALDGEKIDAQKTRVYRNYADYVWQHRCNKLGDSK